MIKLLFCLFGISTCLILGTVAREAIIDGELVENNQERFSYQVSVGVRLANRRAAYCNGGLIGEKFVLTAARCFKTLGARSNSEFSHGMFVQAGTTDRRTYGPPSVIEAVKRIFWPKEYEDQPLSVGNIGVVELYNPLRLPNHSNWKLRLPNNEHETYLGVTAEVAGFGRNRLDEHGVSTTDDKLRFAHAEVIRCPESVEVREHLLCAEVKPHGLLGHARPRGVAPGDIGSPLVHNGEVIGIVSSGPSNGVETPQKPTVYIRVARYLTFVRNALSNTVGDDVETRELPETVTVPSSSK